MKYTTVLLAALAFVAVGKFCHRQTDGFQTLKVITSLPAAAEWNTTPPIQEELDTLQHHFSKPFYFLDSGGQCYAFVSQDGKTVLKLFKMHHLHQFFWLYRCCLPGFLDSLRIRFLLMQKHKLERAFSSSLIASRELSRETGLLYLNLNPTPVFDRLSVTLVDKLGIAHSLSLTNIPFVLQHRADNAFKTIRLHLASGNLESAKAVIGEILDCLMARYKKRIRDLDPALRRNIGLLDDRAIFIDIGSFTATSAMISHEEFGEELRKDTRRMRIWLEKRSPELTAHFDALIDNATPS